MYNSIFHINCNKKSNAMIVILTVIYICNIMITLLTNQIDLTVLVLYHYRMQIIRHGIKKHQNSTIAIQYRQNNNWLIKQLNGNCIDCRIARPSYISNYLIVLKFKELSSTKKHIIILFANELEKNVLHNLIFTASIEQKIIL